MFQSQSYAIFVVDGTVSQRLLAIEAQQAELEAAIAGAVSDGRL